MANNARKYGLRWSKQYNSSAIPNAIECIVATGTNFDSGGNNYNLNAGDPVKRISTGGIDLADPGDAIYGVVAGVEPYWDGSVMKPSPFLPSGVSWGTNLSRQSKVLVVPASLGYWEVDCDDATTATTEAAYQALIGENCDHIFDPLTASLQLRPLLDISTHATADGQWRIAGIVGGPQNQDFSGLYVKLVVLVNEVTTNIGPGYTATGV